MNTDSTALATQAGPAPVITSGRDATYPPPASAAPADSLLSAIIRAASDPNVDIEKFERLMAMRERLETAQEKRDFNLAVANAKADIGPILKNREVDFTSPKGRTNYRHEDLSAVTKAIDGPLSRQGLSYRFSARQEVQGDARRVTITCIVSRGGYCEEATLSAYEDHSGGKNNIQAIVSTATYLQRATLKLALGLAAGHDDDGRAAGGGDAPAEGRRQEPETRQEPLAAELHRLIAEANPDPATVAAFTSDMLKFVRAKSLSEMTDDQIRKAIRAIKQQIADEQKASGKQNAA